MLKQYLFSVFICTSFIIITDTSFANTSDVFNYPFYIGVTGGYASTTWNALVPLPNNQSMTMAIATPIAVKEGGAAFGTVIGYEVSPYFALEANYLHYPKAKVDFDQYSYFSYFHNGQQELTTKTESASLIAKIMLIIPCTQIRAFSSIGPAFTHRSDEVYDHWRITPTFGAGFNYNVTAHIMLELAGNYTAGFGQSEVNPTDDYVPFLYSVVLRLAYRF